MFEPLAPLAAEPLSVGQCATLACLLEATASIAEPISRT